MERVQLDVELRDETGTGSARRLREQGLVPGVVYGRDQEPINLKLDATELAEVTGGNAIIDLQIDDEERTVMVKDVQKDVITDEYLHVDFHQIALDEPIVVEIPISLEGVAEGVREGGVLQKTLRKVEVECLPTEIPSDLKLDISELEVGESLHVGDLEAGEGVELTTSGDEVVVTVVAPTELDLDEDEEELEEEVITEPEVIGEEPDEEEGEEAEVEIDEE
ncbi:50S ribosomal protein L25 [Sporohalobacter salinus]|uniref:50S ribosomal protein L25 n=1 Tax=Sporohalobacter salinus TaxID=1494606 RepID=UPI001961C5B9|nr:50S ribosomal protein L25 [Sporohalobacter salinus]MBM7623893.1 large subunit ribosomal protein L25 [Sporohalobacter salinus]